MRVLGIDLGSREVKIVVTENHKVSVRNKIGTMRFYKDYCSYNGKLQADLTKIGLKNFDAQVSTGYGRNNTDLRNFKSINELKAHVYGAVYQTGLSDFVLLDVGGQDVKIIKVEKGVITDLDLNEKCAASCGRFLENMANVLEIPLEELSHHYEDPVEINATCAVFSESSLIGLIAQGIPIERLCAGINYSLYKRLQPLLNLYRSSRLVLSGGVAQNYALRQFLKNDFNEVIALEDPQYNGALGCCIYAQKILERQENQSERFESNEK